MFSININKSPGPDGYGIDFFKKVRNIIGEGVTNAILQVFRIGKLLKQINSIMITLIPKVAEPQLASQSRPISCYNVLYKCISKMICQRLRKALTHVISNNHAAFVEGRSLVHNILICYDLMRQYNRQTSPRCLMKINLKKAYDMISLDFIHEALKGYGFPESFTNLIMECITSTKFTLKVNGEGYEYFEGR